MKFHKLTHNDAGEDVAPRSPEDWNEWVSATKLRGHLLKSTFGDWLDLYAQAHGFMRDHSPDGYDYGLDSLRAVVERGVLLTRFCTSSLPAA